MNRLLLFIFGSIRFAARGGFPERFINLCQIGGVKLLELRADEAGLTARTSLASFRKIRRCAKRSGVRIKILQKSGLPFIYAHLAARGGLFIGIAAAAFLLFFYSRSIWSIELNGNRKVTREQVIAVLAQAGVTEGVFKKDIDKDKTAYLLYEEIPEIAWLNLGIDGSRLTVDLREVTPQPAREESGVYSNVIAARDGVVDKMRVYSGEAVVKEGDGVHEGELLVSGIVSYKESEKNSFHAAQADIYAFTRARVKIRVEKYYQKTSYTGKTRRFRLLKLFRLRVPLYLFSTPFRAGETDVLERPLIIAGKTLPVCLYEVEQKQTKTTRAKADLKTACALARPLKKQKEKAFGKDVKILQCRQKVTEEDDAFVFTYDYELYENIARRSIIEIIDNDMEK